MLLLVLKNALMFINNILVLFKKKSTSVNNINIYFNCLPPSDMEPDVLSTDEKSLFEVCI